MEKNFQKYGLSHYLGTPILQIHSAVRIIKDGLNNVNPDLLNTKVSKHYDRTIGQTLDSITDAIEHINRTTEGVDDLLITEEYKKQWDEEMKALINLLPKA
jgi:predicted ATPase